MWRPLPECLTPSHSHPAVQSIDSKVGKLLLNDVPGLLFFTTYTLLVLFWAEIYQQARSQATAKLRPTFLHANITVYAVQVVLLLLCGFKVTKTVASVRKLLVHACSHQCQPRCAAHIAVLGCLPMTAQHEQRACWHGTAARLACHSIWSVCRLPARCSW